MRQPTCPPTPSWAGVISDSEVSTWVERAARGGYFAKGVVYGAIGLLAVQQALGSGDAEGSRGALREIGTAAFGHVLLWIVAVGLGGYVVWRTTQALFDPEADPEDDGDAMRWFKRAFYLGSAVVYASLAYAAASLAMGGGGGSQGGGGGSSTWVGQLMGVRWGMWLVGAAGIGIIARGLLQFWKAYTERFKEKIDSYDLSTSQAKWVFRIGRLGLSARGVVFALIGASVVVAAVQRDPQEARGLEQSLEFLVSNPWLLGAVGVGLIGYALYQWTKARYRLIGS